MTLKGNKGEWSELYAFFKLLAEGRLYCGDGKLNRYDDKYYPILKIFRNDAINRNTYKVISAKNSILVRGATVNIEISQKEFKEEAEKLLDHIRNLDKESDFSYIDTFMKKIDCTSIKAKSSDKADIRIVIHNLSTGSKPELGYSIKSKLGAPSTLINSNKNRTNFIFEISNITYEQLEMFNSCKKFKTAFSYLADLQAKISYHGTADDILHNNLTLLDLGIERIIAEGLLNYYSGKGKTLSEITELMSEADPLGIAVGTNQPMYAYKIKQFLLAFALGMTCSTPWYGKFSANGGYIIVKEDGDIVCYHFFDRNDLEDYLFENTRFETPSPSRHDFGYIYRENDRYFLKLNLQIRFI